MSMGLDHRRALSAAMQRKAKENACPVCGRGAAMVMRGPNDQGKHMELCRWIEQGKCQGDGRDLTGWLRA